MGNINAQEDLINQGVLYVADSQLVHVAGNFENSSSLFFNRGDFRLMGNLVNDALVNTTGVGIFRLWGFNEQSIVLNETFGLYDFDVNNSEGVRLFGNSDIEIFGKMNFWNGIIHTTQDALLRFYYSANHQNADDFSHVSGPVQKVGVENFIFPIGKGGIYKPAAIYDLTEDAIFQGEYFSYGFGNYAIDHTLQSVSEKEFWEINRLTSGANARLSLAYDGLTSNFESVDSIDIAYFNDLFWTRVASEPSGASPAAEIISNDMVTNFGYFTLAEKQAFVDDRDAIEFTVRQNADCEKVLAWIVPLNSAILEFEIQRSYDSLDFEVLTTVPGDTLPLNDLKVYWHTDSDFDDVERIYYRLKIKYTNGSEKYSGIREVLNDCIFTEFKIFPNPVHSDENLNLKVTTYASRMLTIEVYSIPGRLLGRQDLAIAAGSHVYELETARLGLPPATYFLKIDKLNTLKFVVYR